jgi:hypothetical protein
MMRRHAEQERRRREQEGLDAFMSMAGPMAGLGGGEDEPSRLPFVPSDAPLNAGSGFNLGPLEPRGGTRVEIGLPVAGYDPSVSVGGSGNEFSGLPPSGMGSMPAIQPGGIDQYLPNMAAIRSENRFDPTGQGDAPAPSTAPGQSGGVGGFLRDNQELLAAGLATGVSAYGAGRDRAQRQREMEEAAKLERERLEEQRRAREDQRVLTLMSLMRR